MAFNDTSTLSTLLPSTPYLLAYALPLLLLSLALNFAGAFLILDRTRSFSPHYEAIPGAFDKRKKKLNWVLEGGLGGLFIGYAFGLHLSTFFALLIPATTTSAALSAKSFVAVWLLSSLVTTALAGRWRYAALGLAGISGGALFALSISVIIHPSLLTRIVFVAITSPILTVMTLLPLARFQHGSLRFATASTGAFGLVLSIALLSHIPAWANVWERLWVYASIDWGTSKEQALSACFCLCLCAGCLCDYFLHRRFGECPDEKWDHYLANYAANLPNQSDRAGTFQPFTSIWERIFGRSHKDAVSSRDILFPDSDVKYPLSPLSPTRGSGKLQKHDSQSQHGTSNVVANDSLNAYEYNNSPGCLKKGRSKRSGHAHFHARLGKNDRKPREAVKFRPLDELSSDSEDEKEKEVNSLASRRPWLRQTSSMASTTTLVNEGSNGFVKVKDKIPNDKIEDVNVEIDYEKEIQQLRDIKRKNGGAVASVVTGLGDGEVPEYSDYEEEDLGSPTLRTPAPSSPHSQEWSPEFIKRHRSSTSGTAVESNKSAHTLAPVPVPSFGAVPATPSLIKALDRVALAQQNAYGGVAAKAGEGLPRLAEDIDSHAHGSPEPEGRGQRWDLFWKEVKEKTGGK